MRYFIKQILLIIAPGYIKQRVFKHYNGLNWKTLNHSEFDAELLLLEFFSDTNTVFFDIGANKGEYGFYAEQIINSKNIYLFEPEKTLYAQLKAIFCKCHVLNIALSNTIGKHKFKIPFINNKLDNCLSSLETDRTEDNETNAIIYEVNTNTLDNFVTQNNISPSLIKIDVEGHELSVIEGAEITIKKYKPTLIIEIEQRHHIHFDVNELFNNFKNLGYNCFYYSKQHAQLFSFEEKKYLTNDISFFGTKNYINNYIFVHSNNQFVQPIEEINKAIKLKISN
jgi:FkbM family methyltransferase